MRYMVTGGAGFIGSHLTRLLLARGHEVTILDNLSHGSVENLSGVREDVVLEVADILDFDGLKRCMGGCDGVFHQAALTSVAESFRDERSYGTVNVSGSENVFRAARDLGIKVVYASTAAVYGPPRATPIGEMADKNPINPYGRTKLECERAAEEHSKLGASIIGLRYFNVYGRRSENVGVTTGFFNAIRAGRPPTIFGSGAQTRDFVHVDDVATANLSAMGSDIRHGFFNIGTGVATSISRLAEMMIELSGEALIPRYLDRVEGDVGNSQADTTLAEELIPWRYRLTLMEGLRASFYPN